jgi:hypothetical protein
MFKLRRFPVKTEFGNLLPLGQIKPEAYFLIVPEQRMVLTFLRYLENNNRNYLWP